MYKHQTAYDMGCVLSVGLWWVQGGRFEVCAAHGVAGVHDGRQPVPIRDGAAAAAALSSIQCTLSFFTNKRHTVQNRKH